MTAIACPCCRAANESGPNCRRCKADLGLLFALMERREYLLKVAERDALRGEIGMAQSALEEASRLKAGPDVQSLRAVVHVLAGEFEAAWTTYRDTFSNPASRP